MSEKLRIENEKLKKHIIKLKLKLKENNYKMLILAKLAADKPMFFNPLHVVAAKTIRDNILKSAESVKSVVSKTS